MKDFTRLITLLLIAVLTLSAVSAQERTAEPQPEATAEATPTQAPAPTATPLPTIDEPVQVIVSMPLLAEIVTVLGAPLVEVTTLIPDDANPHTWPDATDALPAADTLAEADLLLYIGLGYESEALAAAFADAGGYPVGERLNPDFLQRLDPDDPESPIDPYFWLDMELWALVHADVRDLLSEAFRAETGLDDFDLYIADNYAEREAALREVNEELERTPMTIEVDSVSAAMPRPALRYFRLEYVTLMRTLIAMTDADGRYDDSESARETFAAQVAEAGTQVILRDSRLDDALVVDLVARVQAAGGTTFAGGVFYVDTFAPSADLGPTDYLTLMRHNHGVFSNSLRTLSVD